jgi:predicted O-methyltransferase YrrM
VGHLTSIEHDARWYEQVKRRLAEAGVNNVDFRHIPLNHPTSEGERGDYEDVPDYVAVCDDFPDRSLNFVLVDGHYRANCVRRVIPKIAKDGYLLVDDANRWGSLADLNIPTNWRIADDSTNDVKRCVIWQAP